MLGVPPLDLNQFFDFSWRSSTNSVRFLSFFAFCHPSVLHALAILVFHRFFGIPVSRFLGTQLAGSFPAHGMKSQMCWDAFRTVGEASHHFSSLRTKRETEIPKDATQNTRETMQIRHAKNMTYETNIESKKKQSRNATQMQNKHKNARFQ